MCCDSVCLLHLQTFFIFLTTKGYANKSSIKQERCKITNRYLCIRHHHSTTVQDWKYDDITRKSCLKKKHLAKIIMYVVLLTFLVYEFVCWLVVFTFSWKQDLTYSGKIIFPCLYFCSLLPHRPIKLLCSHSEWESVTIEYKPSMNSTDFDSIFHDPWDVPGDQGFLQSNLQKSSLLHLQAWHG